MIHVFKPSWTAREGAAWRHLGRLRTMRLGDGTDGKMVAETEAREEGEDGRLRPGPRALIPVSSASLDSVASTYFRVSTLTIGDNYIAFSLTPSFCVAFTTSAKLWLNFSGSSVVGNKSSFPS